MKVVAYTDGGSRGNPGPSGAGWVFYTPEGKICGRGHEFLGRKTNNEAEYIAVILALKHALKEGVKELHLKADSQLLIRQIEGAYRVKQPHLKVLFDEVKGLGKQLEKFTVEHVRREFNTEADAEANKAMDGAKTGEQ